MALSKDEIAQFRRDGFLTVADAVTPAQLDALKAEVARWVEESRSHDKPFGPPTIDGRPRFDMGLEHSPTNPALRRVNNPSDISPAFGDVMERSRMVDMVADLIGPDVKFHHCKINLKLPGSATEVDYHQDFAYTPHSNDDIVTALLMLDDMTLENGCLTVVPGSHLGPVYSLFADGKFVGYIDHSLSSELRKREVPVTGKAGSVCLMHTRVVHGSDANRANRPRGLYICVYTAADAVPLAASPMPNPNEGRILRGQKAKRARLMPGYVELPEQPKSASFFTVQGQKSKGAA